MTAPAAGTAAFIFWIDGQKAMRDEIPMPDLDAVEQLAGVHADLAESCNEHGRKWMVEVVFSDGEHVRWGTDVGGMVIPVEVGLGELLAALDRRIGGYP